MNEFLIFFVIVSASLAVLFVVREIVTWYFKQNELVKQNEEIIELLTKIEGELRIASLVRERRSEE